MNALNLQRFCKVLWFFIRMKNRGAEILRFQCSETSNREKYIYTIVYYRKYKIANSLIGGFPVNRRCSGAKSHKSSDKKITEDECVVLRFFYFFFVFSSFLNCFFSLFFSVLSQHCWSSVQMLFDNNFLANCRIVSDMTQSTRRKYCVRIQLNRPQPMQSIESGLNSMPFCEFMQCQCYKAPKMLERSVVRCNWNETTSTSLLDFVQSFQITKRRRSIH